eukprot:Skav219435  [mRNA]  locus=scaffold1461:71711:73339:+ [translate_table: standard]
MTEKPKPRNSLDATPSWNIDLQPVVEDKRERQSEMETPREKALREEYKVKKARAIEEAWAQKARFAGKLRPGRKDALAAGRRHDVRFDEQPKHVQEAILSSAAHDNAFNPDSQVIQLALRTKRAMEKRGEGDFEEEVVGFASASKFNGGDYNKRPEFPTHAGDFVWTSAEEFKELRNGLEKPHEKKDKKGKNEKKAKAEKKPKKEKKDKKDKKEKTKKRPKKPKLTKEEKLALQMKKEERKEKKKLKQAEKDVRKAHQSPEVDPVGSGFGSEEEDPPGPCIEEGLGKLCICKDM